MLSAAGPAGLSGDTISKAQEALNTGVIGRRTVTTYHYAKKDIVEEGSFTFRLWELSLAALVGLGGYMVYDYKKNNGGSGGAVQNLPWYIRPGGWIDILTGGK